MTTLQRVRVRYTFADGQWHAESDDVPGWFAVADTEAEIRQLAREGIPFFLDQPVLVMDEDATVPTESLGVAVIVNSFTSTVKLKAVQSVMLVGSLSQGWTNESGTVDRPFPRLTPSAG